MRIEQGNTRVSEWKTIFEYIHSSNITQRLNTFAPASSSPSVYVVSASFTNVKMMTRFDKSVFTMLLLLMTYISLKSINHKETLDTIKVFRHISAKNSCFSTTGEAHIGSTNTSIPVSVGNFDNNEFKSGSSDTGTGCVVREEQKHDLDRTQESGVVNHQSFLLYLILYHFIHWSTTVSGVVSACIKRVW